MPEHWEGSVDQRFPKSVTSLTSENKQS